MSQGRTDEARDVFTKMAAANHVAFPEDAFREMVDEVKVRRYDIWFSSFSDVVLDW